MGKSKRGRPLKNAPLESVFQSKVIARLQKIPTSFWYKINDRATVGIPDILGGVNGYSVAIELKTREKLTKIQHYHVEKIDRAKCQSFVVTPDNFEEVLSFIVSLNGIAPPYIGQLRKPARIPHWCLPAQPRWERPLEEPTLPPKAKWRGNSRE